MSIKLNNISENYSIIGIKSNEKDYKTAWLLNSILDIDLSKKIIENTDFSLFISKYKNKNIILIENKIPGKIFFNDLKEFNFILKISAEKHIINEILNKLKSSNSLYFVSSILKEKITKKTIKILNNLIL